MHYSLRIDYRSPRFKNARKRSQRSYFQMNDVNFECEEPLSFRHVESASVGQRGRSCDAVLGELEDLDCELSIDSREQLELRNWRQFGFGGHGLLNYRHRRPG
jgi:hypothetical protein